MGEGEGPSTSYFAVYSKLLSPEKIIIPYRTLLKLNVFINKQEDADL